MMLSGLRVGSFPFWIASRAHSRGLLSSIVRGIPRPIRIAECRICERIVFFPHSLRQVFT